MYGTQSLRRGAAQALVQAGWSIGDVKCFGRRISDAIAPYLPQVPMLKSNQNVSASMTRLQKLVGANLVVVKRHPALSFRLLNLRGRVLVQFWPYVILSRFCLLK